MGPFEEDERVRKILLLLTVFLIAATPELERPDYWFDAQKKDGKEMSGIAMLGKEMIVVADEAEDHYLYKIERKKKDGRFKLVPMLDLRRLEGWSAVLEKMKETLGVPEKHRRLDLEGIAACPGVLYLANERTRQVLVVEELKRIKVAPIDFLAGFPELFAGEANAGFEGIAADCAGDVLYVAKEREPRKILKVDVKTWKLLEAFDVPPSDRAGQKVINPFTGDGLFDIGPDYADLYFDKGFLYALERNTFEVTKIDPAKKEVIARLSYYKTEKPLYESHEPFGLAENLWLNSGELWIGLDNNGTPTTRKAAKELKYEGEGGVFLIYKRPEGF